MEERFTIFWPPLAPLEASKASNQYKKPCFSTIWKLHRGRPKSPWAAQRASRGPPFFPVHGQGGSSGRPNFLNAPPGLPFGAQGWANKPARRSKRPPIQVKVLKTKYCFPSPPQTIFVRQCLSGSHENQYFAFKNPPPLAIAM